MADGDAHVYPCFHTATPRARGCTPAWTPQPDALSAKPLRVRPRGIGRNACSGSAPRDFEHGRVALVCSASRTSLMSILQSVGGPRSLLSNAMAFSRAYAGGVFCFLLIREILAALCSQRSADQPSSKGSRYGLSCRTGWRGQHAMAPRHRDMARCSRHAATHPLFGFFSCSRRCACRCPASRRRPFDHAESDSEVNHARLCVMRHASCVMRHALIRSCDGAIAECGAGAVCPARRLLGL